jgi:hypothetical protein
MTPFLNATDGPQMTYNLAHTRSRVRIEQAFGILKRRFPGLHYGLRQSPERCCVTVQACFILHNIAMERHDLDILPHGVLDEGNQEGVGNVVNGPLGDGQGVRRRIVEQFFT